MRRRHVDEPHSRRDRVDDDARLIDRDARPPGVPDRKTRPPAGSRAPRRRPRSPVDQDASHEIDRMAGAGRDDDVVRSGGGPTRTGHPTRQRLAQGTVASRIAVQLRRAIEGADQAPPPDCRGEQRLVEAAWSRRSKRHASVGCWSYRVTAAARAVGASAEAGRWCRTGFGAALTTLPPPAWPST